MRERERGHTITLGHLHSRFSPHGKVDTTFHLKKVRAMPKFQCQLIIVDCIIPYSFSAPQTLARRDNIILGHLSTPHAAP